MKTIHQFRVVRRPADVVSRYDAIVVDGSGLPHQPLTIFYHEIQPYVADGTARTYLSSLLPYFEYLTTNSWREHRADQWDSEPEAVRQCVRDYLVEQMHCKAHSKDLYQLISLTAKSPSTVQVFLSALKQFYHVARRLKWYSYPHPLIDSVSHLLQEIKAEEQRAAGVRPRMPQQSGVEEPRRQFTSDNYFKLVQGQWVPQPIDDPDLHLQLRQGFTQARFCLRDQIVVRMAYEAGARIREILRLTVGDWRKRGAKQEAWAFSKGSHGRRVKVLRFSLETAKMLHSYANTERITHDSSSRRLDLLDDADSLFLSSRGNPYDYDSFKKHWYRLCTILGMDLNIHALRHWFVTQEIRLICETAKTPGEIERGKDDLVRYMAWRSPETLAAYEHYFDALHQAQIQDRLHAKWYEEDLHYEQTLVPPIPTFPQPSETNPAIGQGSSSEGWDSLLALGGMVHG